MSNLFDRHASIIDFDIKKVVVNEDDMQKAVEQAEELLNSDDENDDDAGESTSKKRKTLSATGKAKKQSAVQEIKVPPMYALDTVTLGGRPLDANRKLFRCVFPNAFVIGRIFGSLGKLASMFPLCITTDGVSVRLIDNTGVMYIIVYIPKSCFIAYENAGDLNVTQTISSLAFQQRQTQFTNSKTLSIVFQTMPIESSIISVHLFPQSGVKTDDIVSTFTVPVVEAEYTVYEDRDDTNSYHFVLSMSHALLLSVLQTFTNGDGVLGLTVTNHSFDIAGRTDNNSSQSAQISFVPAANDEASIEAVLKQNPKACHCAIAQESTRERPANVVNFCISRNYFAAALRSFVGCRYIKISIGRDYVNGNGEFTPLLIFGSFASTNSSGEPATMKCYVAPRIETDN